MNQKSLQAKLLKAERAVVQGQALVEEQRKLLISNFSNGGSVGDDVELLKQVLEEQRVLVKHRDELLKELAKIRNRD